MIYLCLAGITLFSFFVFYSIISAILKSDYEDNESEYDRDFGKFSSQRDQCHSTSCECKPIIPPRDYDHFTHEG